MSSVPFIKVTNDFKSVYRQQPLCASDCCFHLLHCCPVDVDRWLLPRSSPFVLLTLRERLFSWHHTPRALTTSVSCVVVVGDQAYYCCVVCKLDEWVGGLHGHAVMGKQWRCCFLPSAPGGGPSKSRTQLHRAGLRPRASSLMMSLEDTMELNAEL